ncbi:MAG: nuclease, partial [Acidobacteriota bacterium]|nr:nuclease [Acidobacteriota bacterium]
LMRLDTAAASLSYLPIDTKTLRRAAELWADARRRGRPTAPPDALVTPQMISECKVKLAGEITRRGRLRTPGGA